MIQSKAVERKREDRNSVSCQYSECLKSEEVDLIKQTVFKANF